MGLYRNVRVGGMAALVLLCVGLNVSYADTLSYFYGYSDPNFGAYRGADAYSSQNVSMTPEVSMITVQAENPTSNFGSVAPSIFTQTASAITTSALTVGYSVMVQSYGYAAPATTQASTSTAVSGTTYVAPTVIVAATDPTPTATVSTVVPTTSYASTSYGTSVYTGYGVSTTPVTTVTTTTSYTSPTSSATYTPVVYTAATTSYASYGSTGTVGISTGLDGSVVGAVVTPRFESSITAPVTSTNLPSINIGGPVTLGLDAPEPATLGIVGLGLGLLALRLRRK